MTYAEAAELVEMMDQSYSECRAEAGMGAVSFGLDPYGAMMTVNHPSDDPDYREARKLLKDRYEVVKVIQWSPFIASFSDDIPF